MFNWFLSSSPAWHVGFSTEKRSHRVKWDERGGDGVRPALAWFYGLCNTHLLAPFNSKQLMRTRSLLGASGLGLSKKIGGEDVRLPIAHIF